MSKADQKFMHNLEIDKVAFVDHPANKSEFLLFKAENKIDKDKHNGGNMAKELTKELKELLKSRNYSDEQIEEIEKANHSDEELKDLEKTAKMLPKVKKATDDKDKKTKKDGKDYKDGKDGKDDKIKKVDVPTLVALRKDLDDERARGNKLEKDLLIEKEHRVQDVYLTKAAALPFIPMKKSELAGMIRFVAESDQKDDFKKAFDDMLASVNSLVKQASVFHEVGRSGAASVLSSASDDLISKAQERIAKGEAKNLSLDEVVEQLVKEDPSLYEDHLNTFPDAGEETDD